jgi:DNA-directed RNA polymerase specialized sigma24 family protein
VSGPLTDQDLASLKHTAGERACADPRILAVLGEVARAYPREKIHWLPDDSEEVLGGWIQKRLVQGRLAAMIDKAESVRGLRAMLAEDLQQYANEERRGDLDARLFKRLKDLLPSRPEHFKVLFAADAPGSNYWTLADRPALAVFSGSDAELVSHVFATALRTLPENPMATKGTQFLTAPELERYAYETLDRTARALSLDQLTRGLVLAYGLRPTFTELPDESLLGDDLREDEPEGIRRVTEPGLPDEQESTSAQEFLAALNPRQVEVLRGLHVETKQTETAARLGCSAATISSEVKAIRTALMKWPEREEQLQVLRQTNDLLDRNGQ